ncbi:MAG TPA: hypothetical protein PKN15_13225 [Chitinophagales bacterium]|nr:hypothetical protein [Saprospiraceae bacterium]HNO29747.1 hypothetical protein [Chitinophagales bacterium]
MKHLVRKYVSKVQLTQEVIGYINSVEKKEGNLQNAAIDNMVPNFVTTEGELIQSFVYKIKNTKYLIPEPNPIVMYFDTGRAYLNVINRNKIILMDQLNLKDEDQNVFKLGDKFYYYFATCVRFVVFQFLALEAMLNKLIPYDFEYKKDDGNKRSFLYKGMQIQRNIEFKEKLQKVIPLITSKDFANSFPKKYHIIENLKNFRDEIVHTKSQKNSPTSNYYSEMYLKAMDFKYEETLYVVRDFINYYDERLLEECDCGLEED